MSLFKVGDVLALPYFPNQEDPKEGTARYILIVEIFNDSYSIIPFTSQIHQSNRYENTIKINKDDDIGKKMGLKYDSILMIDRRMEIKKIVARPPVLGNCGEDFLEENNL
ncbi:MAG: hypothetical protein IPL10_16545 [Bacteroidetes bacterium]|nr:hypothetical protein [Bacteroidota bacterium]